MGEAREPGVVTRLYVEEPLSSGATVTLDRDRAHYLKNVLRAAPGQTVGLFNGRDGEWRARIDALAKQGATLVAEARRREQMPEPDLWLVFAPVKKARIDFIAEKATELGAAALVPVMTRFTAVSRVNTERLRANAIEAAEQTERLSVPEVREPVPLARLLADWPPERRILLCAEAGAARPIAAALHAFAHDSQAAAAPWAVMTGPEGGFAAAELDGLEKLPFVTAVGLGPRILRADTAALAALACFQAILGDGRGRPPMRDNE
ncbi:MAG: ribosomal RNA small subunit methyltransferase E [Alphaproteobacteria bacterium]|nr:MAG: ribosomal RNA small subunit methyltransferase E [Alphaproteobacteria bacterium]